jgi:hypothetical protein
MEKLTLLKSQYDPSSKNNNNNNNNNYNNIIKTEENLIGYVKNNIKKIYILYYFSILFIKFILYSI